MRGEELGPDGSVPLPLYITAAFQVGDTARVTEAFTEDTPGIIQKSCAVLCTIMSKKLACSFLRLCFIVIAFFISMAQLQ